MNMKNPDQWMWLLYVVTFLLLITTDGKYFDIPSCTERYLGLGSCKPSSVISVEFNIETTDFLHSVDERFLSYTLDADVLVHRQEWKDFNISSNLLLTLSRELSPAFLRFGGTASDYIIFTDLYQKDACQQAIQSSSVYRFYEDSDICMSKKDWIKLNHFCSNVNWTLLFDLNALLRKQGAWDPTNAISLLKFNNDCGYHVAWELGNELNSHNQVSGHQLGKDFLILRNLLNAFPATNHSLLVGPDISSSHDTALSFLHEYLKVAAPVLDAVTFHQYSLNGYNSTLDDFLNVDNFDTLNITINKVSRVVNHIQFGSSMWLGETGTAYGGGTPGLSDAYISGFLWLDKLGLSALNRIDVVIRQSLMFAHYGLITSDLEPLPDYWLTLLYKWLVGPRVLQVSKVPHDRKIRVYAHCTAYGKLYNITGAITAFVVNLHNSTLKVNFSVPHNNIIHEYLLTPFGEAGLHSKFVSLNGKHLKLVNDSLPRITPKVIQSGLPIIVPSFTFGFYVLPKAGARACLLSEK